MASLMSQASEYAAGDPPPERVHVGEPKDLFPAPFVGQRVALRTPSRGPEVRLFTVGVGHVSVQVSDDRGINVRVVAASGAVGVALPVVQVSVKGGLGHEKNPKP